jgi:uncharacterized protein (TIGR03083 family)
MTMTDLGPAADTLCALIAAVADSDLGRPTPCTEYTVGDLLHHISWRHRCLRRGSCQGAWRVGRHGTLG